MTDAPNCDSCGFYIPAETCRDDIKADLVGGQLAGVCGEASQCVVRLHYIAWPATARCGKHQPTGWEA